MTHQKVIYSDLFLIKVLDYTAQYFGNMRKLFLKTNGRIDELNEITYVKALSILLGMKPIRYWRCLESIIPLLPFQAQDSL